MIEQVTKHILFWRARLWVPANVSPGVSKSLGHSSIPAILSLFYLIIPNPIPYRESIPPTPNTAQSPASVTARSPGTGARRSTAAVRAVRQAAERSQETNKAGRVRGRNFISSATITSKCKYLENLQITSMVLGKWVTCHQVAAWMGLPGIWSALFLSTLPRFCCDRFLYRGEPQWSIPFIHSRGNLAVSKPSPYRGGG